MSTAIHLCSPAEADRLCALMAQYHAETGRDIGDEQRRAAVLPLVEGAPHGVAYLFGPARAATGYVIVSFGWSVEFGGLEARIVELYIRPNVRGRGIGQEALNAIAKALGAAGVKALHLDLDRNDAATMRFAQKARFAPRDGVQIMTRRL